MTATGLERVLGNMEPERFIRDYYLRIPYSAPGGAGELAALGSWALVGRVLACDDVDLMIARGDTLTPREDRTSFDQARALHAAGHTLVIRHAERHDPSLAELARAFEVDFKAPVNVHVYCTPANAHGFGWHYDVEEVFIVQTVGEKRYVLRRNTVNPWPLLETFPRDLQFEREVSPHLECTLEKGDLLYVPAGYWHLAHTFESEAISLALGVMAPPALRVLDYLRSMLASSLMWRHRLPIPGAADDPDYEGSDEGYRRIVAELASDVSTSMQNPEFVDGLRSWLTRPFDRGRSGSGSATCPD